MARLPSLASYRAARQRGLSLIELVVFIVVVAIGLTGIMSVLILTSEKSSDPMVRKQGIAVAEAMLEEVLLKSFAGACPPLPLTCTVNLPADRPNYAAVTHYNGWNQNGVASLAAPLAIIPGLENYNVTVVVVPAALGDIPADGTAVSITVTVTDTITGEAIALVGFRTNYF